MFPPKTRIALLSGGFVIDGSNDLLPQIQVQLRNDFEAFKSNLQKRTVNVRVPVLK